MSVLSLAVSLSRAVSLRPTKCSWQSQSAVPSIPSSQTSCSSLQSLSSLRFNDLWDPDLLKKITTLLTQPRETDSEAHFVKVGYFAQPSLHLEWRVGRRDERLEVRLEPGAGLGRGLRSVGLWRRISLRPSTATKSALTSEQVES